MSKKNSKTPVVPMTAEGYIKSGRARSLPIDKCYINADWEDSGIASIFVSRKHINGNITAASYLVDLYCAGVKDSFYHFNEDESAVDQYLDFCADSGMEMHECEYALVHNIVYTAVEFASEYGIRPAKEFEMSKHILNEDSDDIEFIEIECGKNGKPFLIVNPEDQRCNYYLAQLKANAGENNFEVDYEDSIEDDLDSDNHELYPDIWNENEWASFFEDRHNRNQLVSSFNVVACLYQKLIAPTVSSIRPEIMGRVKEFELIDEDDFYNWDGKKNNQLAGILKLYEVFSPESQSDINDLCALLKDAIEKWPDAREFYVILYNVLFQCGGKESELDSISEAIYRVMPNDIVAAAMYGLYLLRNNRADEFLKLFNNKYALQEIVTSRNPTFMEVAAFHIAMCSYFLQIDDIPSAVMYGRIFVENGESPFFLKSDSVDEIFGIIMIQVVQATAPFFDNPENYKTEIAMLAN
ncbi:hypothetical protein QTN47_10140 [Danxiaibacter flavus]|uniref:DUF1186 domain-containing protein n=1 Tax=Danxiaibacter flavus TaxID=3049108 RepID=A0ABV3ZEC7_9BACT|nr:hypothetical protein QNM32_10140 [Chitinophagaceae bacterium DXS]